MKFLDYPELETLSRALTFESPECKVFTRLEAYSCKAVKSERQLFKTLESQYLQSASMSPPNYIDETLASPFGRLDQSHARKTLFLLIATLNGAFPDHDFSGVHPSDFRREDSSDSVLNSLGTTLLQLRSNSNAPRSFSSFPSSYDEEDRAAKAGRSLHAGKINHPQLNAVLDDIMSIPECEVYTFHPDADSDPHASAEPDEEGDEMDDERYADDESLSEDDDDDFGRSKTDMSGSNQDMRMSTPRRGSSFDEEMEDAPMFDEDLLGFGFTPVQSRMSSTATTPRTPSSTRARAGDFFSSKTSAAQDTRNVLAASAPGRMANNTLSSRTSLQGGFGTYGSSFGNASSEDDVEEEEYDDGQGMNGLLWATYAFFYNRKQKRILFVSVWSRRNTSGIPSYSFSPPSYPAINRHLDDVPPLSIDHTISSGGAPMNTSKTNIKASVPSPAKRAIARSTGRSSSRTKNGAKRGREGSASPSPSLRSPFPHDSPSAQSKNGLRPNDVKSALSSFSQTAPQASASPLQVQSQMSAGSASAIRAHQHSVGLSSLNASSLSSSNSSAKRSMATSNDDDSLHHSQELDQSSRKQRRVGAMTS